MTDFGELLPRYVIDGLGGDECRFMLVNVTEGTTNALPTAFGPDRYVLVCWNAWLNRMTVYDYWNI